MPEIPYQLAEHVHACVAGDRLVFLDLAANRYLCLNAENTQVALRLLSWQNGGRPSESTPCLAGQGRVSLIARTLLDRRLLTKSLGITRPADPRRAPMAATRTIAPSKHAPNLAKKGQWRLFLVGATSASAKLRCWSMLKTVQSVRRRKNRANEQTSSDETEISELVTAFHRLRPFYPRAYLCLYDSLALLEFLSRQGYYPLWVFGVKSDPFGAHCWVQWNDLALNDSVAHIRQYAPIMII